jgi:hypothetical protein
MYIHVFFSDFFETFFSRFAPKHQNVVCIQYVPPYIGYSFPILGYSYKLCGV